ncbi:MAG: PorV/PorQ family protein [candidate division Zixibacteria bacterium]|nr:PorV/PorQ family protein [candidate division Zixibacteria bacterium]
MKKIILILAAAALAATAIPANAEFAKVGTVGLKFLDIGVGGRALAMGEAYTAIADDASSVFWNPAGTANIESGDFFAGYTKWPADINLYSFAIAKNANLPLMGTGTLTFSSTLLNTGKMNRITEYDSDGDFSGTFAYEDYSVGMTIGKYLTDKFAFGATAKYLHEKIDYWDIDSWAVDIGTYYETGFKSIRIGMAIMNFGPDVTFKVDDDGDGRVDEDLLDGESQDDDNGDGVIDGYDLDGEDLKQKPTPIPLTFRAGLAMNVYETESSKATFVAEVVHPSDNIERYQFGGEYWFQEMIAFRAGYKMNMDEGGFTAGVGLVLPFSASGKFSLDYAWNDMGLLSNVHRLSTSLAF